MRILHGLDGLASLPARAALSIGNFDGLHLGHRRILQTALELAKAESAIFAAVTFEPHPMTVLRPELAPARLTPPSIKQKLFESMGVDHLVILPPEPSVLNLQAEQFWTILRDQVKPAHLVEGASFRFGKGAAGSVENLRVWSAGTGISLHVVESVFVPLLDLNVAPVSSSLIRFLLDNGRVRDAAICLGRPYSLSGSVAQGHQRGRTIGFPTANLKPDDQLIPPDGVYAGRALAAGTLYPAAVSIGTMPTFGENLRQIEAHLIGFDGDLYGQPIEIHLLDWLREQQKYAQLESLVAQIKADVAETNILARRDPARPIAHSFA